MKTDWISVNDALPEEHGEEGKKTSALVNVLLDNGETDEDWLINGRWVFYCKNSKTMPHVVAWKEKQT